MLPPMPALATLPHWGSLAMAVNVCVFCYHVSVVSSPVESGVLGTLGM